MKMNQMKLAALGAALAAGAGAQASVMVTFDGYSTGEVVGQPATGTKWTGTSARFAVDATVGVGGGYGLISTTSNGQYNSVYFTPSSSEVGGTWGTNTTATYSFKAKLISGTGTAELYRIYIGNSGSNGAHITYIGFRADGSVSGNGSTLSGGTPFADHEFHPVTVVADYASSTYTLYVNNVQRQTAAFVDVVPAFTTYAGYQLNIRTGDAANNRIAFDDLSITVPEPGVASLLGATCVMGLMARRRAHS